MTDQRVLWVTGGGSGMGAAGAEAAARDGWTVVLSGRRADRLEQVAGAIRATGGTADVLPLDANDPAAVAAARDVVLERHGRLDGLLLAAGLNAPRRRWDDQSLTDFRAIVDTNLTAAVTVVDAALPALRSSGGVVVVVSSYAGWSFQPGAGVAYSASKTALGSVVRSLNQQEAEHGVRATHLCPGDVATDFLDQRPEVPDAAARQRMLQPEDVGRTVAFVLGAPAHVRVDELVLSPVSQR
ncbi:MULTISPECIES: SDR family oxidoreductase [Curtobacterium]|jgi:NADP-dependent 3-hydroxy acid dehydrogenase YdfG|uniref:SDR family oxidoreductase n=1 Tax=Curtobacterium TaxID=2034 RepID=UPI0008DCB3DC|nr:MULTISPECIES: SDR family NAD(P)-dependent oxidoreductase [Curtobacterium]MCS6563957.1 SDR family NAD(P)-dependent oxidoreductase [Curtobacterium flaccumfaciens pv. flaccumfaciens]MCS6574413.1 SDR family NAD(P)-dependent oxidoreductase [Curtobacterium flaccumfaciens pv. flaccumfaciens]MDD1385532.1 SDR family NAD(P)-dependent oxidoreductase [Curtobacterium flaccumfaciens pv. poinsettiae]OII04564.1 short-chain dehydrogenase [Curtobacterium sp. MCBA15_007]VXA90311.1 Short-chain dehydrogenase [C